jgi:hypothetical protein
MPRKLINPDRPVRVSSSGLGLGEALAEELRSKREFGQPVIEEEHFKTGLIRVSVLWDKWDRVPHEERTKAILHAYRLVEGPEFAGKITMAGGLTYPEAVASGMLPVRLFPALRGNDPVSPEQCHRALIDEGASILLDPDHPELWFSSEEEAKAARERLIDRLPESEPCWVIVTMPDLKSFQGFEYTK